MYSNAEPKTVVRPVSDLESFHGFQQVQRHSGDFGCVHVTVFDRQTAYLKIKKIKG